MMKTLTIFLLLVSPIMIFGQSQYLDLLIGTYTNSGKSEGIYVYTFDSVTGAATQRSVATSKSPSFLTMSEDRKYAYAVNESSEGKGAVSAYAYDGVAGRLTFLNQRLTEGDGPCHIVTDRKGTHVIVSNYSGGSISVFAILPDGSIGPLKQLIQHEGSGPDPNRQKKPHVHSAFFSPDEQQLFVQDLGTDKINIYDFHPNGAKPLVPAAQPFIKGAPGGGPRHVALAEDGQFIYLVQEMTAHVMVFERKAGTWTSTQEIAMNEPGFKGNNGAADIKLSPDGKFLYASNRGDANTLAIYEVDATTGLLNKIGNQSVLGNGPRNFTMSPDGKYLLVGNQNTDEVVVFSRDLDTGLLTDTGHRIAVGAPVCLVFVN